MRGKQGTGGLFKRGGVWWIRYQMDNKACRESTHLTSEGEARVFQIKRLREIGRMSANAATLATEGLTSTIGCAGELLVAADLMNHNIEVFRALSIHGSCDLIALRAGRMARIEVKVCPLGKCGNPVVGLKRQVGRFDILAAVDRHKGIFYFPSLEKYFNGPVPLVVGTNPEDQQLVDGGGAEPVQ